MAIEEQQTRTHGSFSTRHPATLSRATDYRAAMVNLDELLADRGMTLTRLSELVGVSMVNLSVLKNDRARAIRFSTLRAICRVLHCDVGDLLVLDEPRS